MADIVAKRIGELLVEAGVLSQSQLEQALFAQRKDGRKLGQLLIELGLVTEVQLTQTLSRQLSVPWVSLYHVDFSRSLLNMVPRAIAEKFCLVPIFVRRVRKLGETLYVAMDDPTNEAAIDEVRRASTLPVKPMIACPSDIRAAIRVYYQGEEAASGPGLAAVGSSPKAVPPAPPSSEPLLGAKMPPPAPPARTPTVPDAPDSKAPDSGSVESVPSSTVAVAAAPPPTPLHEAAAPPPAKSAEKDAKEGVRTRRNRPRMISLTLLDGTSISIPGPPKQRGSMPEIPVPPNDAAAGMSDQLTARDLVSALRAVAHGVDASDILGTEPKWEAMFSALLSILLRKGLIADWEFVEEFRKI
jgi:type IV pilus assembly protein PilB